MLVANTDDRLRSRSSLRLYPGRFTIHRIILPNRRVKRLQGDLGHQFEGPIEVLMSPWERLKETVPKRESLAQGQDNASLLEEPLDPPRAK